MKDWERLQALLIEHGFMEWAEIRPHFPGRTSGALRQMAYMTNRHHGEIFQVYENGIGLSES